jgi:hypothetical protein
LVQLALRSLKFARDQTPAFFKFYAPSDPTAGTDGFVNTKIPTTPWALQYLGTIQLSHSASGWTLTASKAETPGSSTSLMCR